MLLKIGIRLSALLLAFVVLGGIAHAQKPTRINFKRGTSAASVSGSLAPGGKRTYVMHVREDQEIHAVLSGKGVSLDNGMLTMQYNAPNGDNFIQVINRTKRPTKYTMTVAIQ